MPASADPAGDGPGFTVLTSASGRRGAKIHRRLSSGGFESADYDSETWWRAAWIPLVSFDDMVAKVVPLQEQQHSVVILGKTKDGVDLSQPVRRKKRGVGAAFTDALVRVLPIDLDNTRADHLDVIGDPGGAIQYAIDEVAEHAPELEGASCLAIFSSSAGVKDTTTAKLRLWHWLARPYPLADLKRWAEQVNARAKYKLIDVSLYQAVQLIYVARPSFEGMPDPLPGARRYAVIEGYADSVELQIDAVTPRKIYTRTGDGVQVHFGGGVEAHIAAIDGNGGRGLREPAKAAIGAFIAQHGAERAEQRRGEILGRVAEALANADPGNRSAATVQGYIDGLDGLFDWTLDQQRAGEATRIVEIIPDTRPRLPLEEGRKALREMVGAAADALLAVGWNPDLDEEPPPAALVNASLGFGKTEAGGQTALDLFDPGVMPLALGAPTHKLNKEVRDRVRAMGKARNSAARIAMQIGRDSIDPDGDGVALMCSQIDIVREVQAAGISDIQGHVCRRVVSATDAEGNKTRTEHLCPDFRSCRYQENHAEVKGADIVLVSHAALGHRGAKKYAAVFIDENPIHAMLRGHGGSEDRPREWILVSPADLSNIVTTKAGATDKARTTGFEIDNPDLVTVRGRMGDLRRDNGRGYVRRETLAELGFTSDELRGARKQALELQTRAVRDILPGMDPHKRRELLPHANKNAALRNEAKLYELLADFIDREDLGPACGWVRLTTIERDGMRHEVWRLVYLARVAEQYRAPSVLLDATMRGDFRFALRALFPGLRDELGGELLAASPHRKVRAVRSPNWTLGEMRGDPKAKAREAQAYMLREVRALGGGQAVAVTNKAVAVEMTATPVEGVEAVHFALVRGLDRWRGARYQATLGRPQPSPEAVETMAAAITGRGVEPLGEKVWYSSVERPILGRGGQVLGWQRVPQHPDPAAEACRWQIAEAALIQSERLRGVERTAENPALWDLIGCPIPDGVEVDEVIDYQEPTSEDLMLALGGAVLCTPAHAVRFYPEIWPVVAKDGETEAEALDRTIRAAKQAASRAGGGRHSLNISPIKGMSPTSVRYQVKGAGARPAEALVLPAALPGFRAALEARLGPLAWYGQPEIRKVQAPRALADDLPEAVPFDPLMDEAVVYLGDIQTRLDQRLNFPLPVSVALLGTLAAVTTTASARVWGPVPDF